MLTKEDIKHIANLAKINLNNKEIEKYHTEFNELIAEIDEIMGINLDGNYINKEEGILREDVVLSSISKNKVLANSGESENGFIKVSSKGGLEGEESYK